VELVVPRQMRPEESAFWLVSGKVLCSARTADVLREQGSVGGRL
jgi:hypothetical protein